MLDKILRGICWVTSVIFGLMASLAAAAIIFGILIAMHTDNPADVMEQVRALGIVFIACFVAGAALNYVSEGTK